MAQGLVPPAREGGTLSSRPWLLLLIGLGMTTAAWLLGGIDAFPSVPRVLLVLAGTALAGLGILFQLRLASWTWPERLEPAALVSLAGLVALTSYLAMQPDWDSGKMFYGAVFLASLIGALLIVLTPLYRRVVISLLLLFHFAGMAAVITSVDPPGHTGPWLSKQLWTWVYRPYLSFLYLTNAYHFYSPEPGPPTLFWFAIRYSDGTYTWVKLPERANSPHNMHYNRLLALPQHSFVPSPQMPLSSAQLASVKPEQYPERGSWEQIYTRRMQGSEFRRFLDRESGKVVPIPMVTDLEFPLQFSEPTEVSKRYLAGVAKRALTHLAPPAKEGVRPVTVKLYRVVHQVLTPYELASGVSPLAKNKHWAYFLGEFNQEGKLLDSREPFLYWYLPIAYVAEGYPETALTMASGVPAISVRSVAPKNAVLLDCLEMHAAGVVRINDEPQEKK